MGWSMPAHPIGSIDGGRGVGDSKPIWLECRFDMKSLGEVKQNKAVTGDANIDLVAALCMKMESSKSEAQDRAREVL